MQFPCQKIYRFWLFNCKRVLVPVKKTLERQLSTSACQVRYLNMLTYYLHVTTYFLTMLLSQQVELVFQHVSLLFRHVNDIVSQHVQIISQLVAQRSQHVEVLTHHVEILTRQFPRRIHSLALILLCIWEFKSLSIAHVRLRYCIVCLYPTQYLFTTEHKVLFYSS